MSTTGKSDVVLIDGFLRVMDFEASMSMSLPGKDGQKNATTNVTSAPSEHAMVRAARGLPAPSDPSAYRWWSDAKSKWVAADADDDNEADADADAEPSSSSDDKDDDDDDKKKVTMSVSGTGHIGGPNGFNATMSASLDVYEETGSMSFHHDGGWTPLRKLFPDAQTGEFDATLEIGENESATFDAKLAFAGPVPLFGGITMVGYSSTKSVDGGTDDSEATGDGEASSGTGDGEASSGSGDGEASSATGPSMSLSMKHERRGAKTAIEMDIEGGFEFPGRLPTMAMQGHLEGDEDELKAVAFNVSSGKRQPHRTSCRPVPMHISDTWLC